MIFPAELIAHYGGDGLKTHHRVALDHYCRHRPEEGLEVFVARRLVKELKWTEDRAGLLSSSETTNQSLEDC